MGGRKRGDQGERGGGVGGEGSYQVILRGGACEIIIIGCCVELDYTIEHTLHCMGKTTMY